jgi:SAM-dependent methyltransferase
MGTISIQRDVDMALISDIDAIMEFDRTFWEISRDLHRQERLPLRTGSLLRVSESAYERWGIMITPENREALRAASERLYLKDAEEQMTRPDMDAFIKTDTRREIEGRMANLMADLAKTFLAALGERRDKMTVCDIPARDGQLSCAIATELRYHAERLVNMTEFHLVDRASLKLAAAQNNMRLRGAAHEVHCRDDARFIDGAQKEKFDVIVSLSHLHHKSFLADYLRRLHSMLADDGVLIIGDWHSAIWDHPLNARNLLRRIGADERKLDVLCSHFGPELMAPDRNVVLKPEEVQAIQDHFEYWQEVADNVRRSELLSSMRIHFLEAHDTSKARRTKLEEAGFTTSQEDIRAAFPGVRLEKLPRRIMPSSDFAVVMAAVKRTAGRNR